MLKRCGSLLLAVFIALGLTILLSLFVFNPTTAQRDPHASASQQQQYPPPFVDPSALRLVESYPKELPVIILLHSTMPVSTSKELQAENTRMRREMLVKKLRLDFHLSQQHLAASLDEARSHGTLLESRDLWIINGMALTVRPELFHQLQNNPMVKAIYLDNARAYIEPVSMGSQEISVTALPTPGSLWGIDRIRVPQVWQTFGISGTGAVVAIMDTGVDFLHPALAANYRGNMGKGLYTHHTSWFDAVNEGIYPYDDQGHGSHVAGTAIGAMGIGVAPDAKWIGVKVLNTDGYGYDSWILNGFQWILAPDSNPALAPDIVNASWSSSNASNTVFEQAIQTLTEAGILVVTANGNGGPAEGTVGAPASYPGVFGVGASDEDDEIAPFSARGPTP
ncbi:MAG: S8 family serine peptidase, partial [Anaerolineae bacterium]|nr:S8 family serine peptidase [Anaerolineae bacterium]